jgi:hypothetical protein
MGVGAHLVWRFVKWWVARAHGAVVEFWGRRTEGAIMLVAGVDSSTPTQTPK